MAPSAKAGRPSLAAQAGQAVVWNTLFLPAKFVAEIVVNLLQLNILSVTAVGMLSLIRAAVGGFGMWIDLGIERALPKFIPELQRSGGNHAVRQLLLRVTAVKLGVLAVFAAGLWLLRERFLGKLAEDLANMERLSAVERAPLLLQLEQNGWFFITAIVLLLVLGSIYDVLIAYLISYFRQRAWNSITLANALVLPLLISLGLLLGWDITGVVMAMLATAVIGVFLAGWQVRAVARAHASDAQPPSDDPGALRRFVPYSALSYLFNISDFAASASLGIFVLGNLRDAALLWTGVSLVRQILAYLYTPVVGLQVPLFTRARAGEGATLPGAYAAVTRILLLFLLPGAVGLMLLARPLVLAQYPQYIAMAPVILLLTPLLFLESLLSTSQNALMVAERYRPIILARLVAFVSVPLLLLLAPRYGPVGAAAALGAGRVLAGLIVFVAGARLLELRFPWDFAGRLAVASAAMGLLLLLLTSLLPDTAQTYADRFLLFFETMLVAACAGALFVLVLRLLGGLDERDRAQLAATRLPLKRFVLRIL